MNRLTQELQRLHLPQPDAGPGPSQGATERGDSPGEPPGLTHSLVLELARPADWAALSAVWAGVQTDLGLPAPAIAVNGHDGLQLWFPLHAALPSAQAAAFLGALCRRYLGEVAPARVTLWPALPGASAAPPLPPRPVPALQADSGLWSAFVAPDLVPMFDPEPWLDMPPNPDGQAQLLAALKPMRLADFELAWQRLAPPMAPAAQTAAQRTAGTAAQTTTHMAAPVAAPVAGSPDPRRFLLEVMQDPGVDLALRIEAAKALLAVGPAAQGPGPADGVGRPS